MRKSILLISLLLIAFVIFSCTNEKPVAPELSQSEEVASLTKQGPTGEPEVVAAVLEMNEQLAALGMNIRIESVEFFTVGVGRPSTRILQQPFRWRTNDPNRFAQGNDITYIVDQSGQGTASGVSGVDTENRADAAMSTWNADQALKNVALFKRVDPGSDVTIFDFVLGGGGFGNPFAADIVSAGFFPAGPPFFGPNTLAFSVTFIFIDGNGNPFDGNGDNYIDTALNEVYFNDGFNWGLDVPLGLGFDVETVSLHEFGHSLGVGHFGPPPNAVMNPIYAGIRQSPFPADHAGMATIWAQWPNN